MRYAWMLVLVIGCADSASAPQRPSSCPRECTPDDADCATFPYNQLPPRCLDICNLGSCCELVDDAWQIETYDCDRGSGMPLRYSNQ